MEDNSFSGLSNLIESSPSDLFKLTLGEDWYIIQMLKKDIKPNGIGPTFEIISSNSLLFSVADPATCFTMDYKGYDPILEMPLSGSVMGTMFHKIHVWKR